MATGRKSLTFKQTVVDGNNIQSVETVVTGDQLIEIEVTLAASTSPQEIKSMFPKDNVVACSLHCTRATTLKTNSSSAPDDTIALAAGVLVPFYTGNGDNPFDSADVTTLFAVQAANTATAILTLKILTQTP